MPKDVIIALDFQGIAETQVFLDEFPFERPFVKVGMELFYAEGPAFVSELVEQGYKVFLDLKLHDIPNTVAGAMRSLTRLGVGMINLHAAGGSEMMKRAREVLENAVDKRPLLIAVTQLTSTSAEMLNNELLISARMEDTVLTYAKNAQACGVDGVVCSPMEAALIKRECGSGFLTVTPGIRFAGSESDDQKRVMTPAEAREAGSDYIVVGRPITGADNPIAAYKQCLSEFLGGR